MQRFDGSLNFNRNWIDYRNGFGELGGKREFWLGNELIHLLTSTAAYTLRIEVACCKLLAAIFQFVTSSKYRSILLSRQVSWLVFTSWHLQTTRLKLRGGHERACSIAYEW